MQAFFFVKNMTEQQTFNSTVSPGAPFLIPRATVKLKRRKTVYWKPQSIFLLQKDV